MNNLYIFVPLQAFSFVDNLCIFFFFHLHVFFFILPPPMWLGGIEILNGEKRLLNALFCKEYDIPVQ